LSTEYAGRRSEIGLYCHLSAGPSWAESEHISSLLRNNFQISQVAAFPYIVPNSVTGNVCKALRISGHNTTLCLGPGAGLMGLGFAAYAIQNGHSNFIVSLSVDELSDRILLDSLSAGLILDDTVPPAEAACAFTLESIAGARARGATILGTVCSSAYSTETEECSLPSDDTGMLAETIQRALDQANITADNIGLICRNAENGREERAICTVVENRQIPVLDLSPQLGCAEACAPMLTLAYALQNSFLQDPQSKEYILVVFASSHGVNCVMVIHKGNPKEKLS
jgi:3-oxoacyl-(acyl-carrier-protein) synthase